ncbi:MAG: hypothetical protein U0M15_07490 [Bacillota bacterium]|nr:hypothetical protein [Bacillota bacterium]
MESKTEKVSYKQSKQKKAFWKAIIITVAIFYLPLLLHPLIPQNFSPLFSMACLMLINSLTSCFTGLYYTTVYPFPPLLFLITALLFLPAAIFCYSGTPLIYCGIYAGANLIGCLIGFLLRRFSKPEK